MPKWVVGSVVMAMVVVGVPLAVLAATGTTQETVSCQTGAYQTSPVSTSSTGWTTIPGLQLTADSVWGMSVNVSGVFSGAPVALRVTDTFVGGTFTLQPGVAYFQPGPASTGESFTWLSAGAPAEHAHTFQVQWHVSGSGGGSATLVRGDSSVLYEFAGGGTCTT